MPVRGVVLLTFFVLSLPVCFIRPFYGVLMWTVVAFLNPQSALYYWPAALSFPWAMAVAVPTLAGFALFSKGWINRLRSPAILMMLILFGWFTLTSFVSTSNPLFMHHAEDTWSRWQLVGKILLMTFLIIAVTDSFERLRWLMLTIAGCFGYYVLKAVPFMAMTGGAFRLYGPEHSMIADNNDFGLALNMTVPIFFFLARTESAPWVRRLLIVLFLSAIPAVFCTYSRGALVGLIAIGLMMILQLKQRIILLPVLALAVAFAVLFAPDAWKERMDPTQAVDASARERLNAWAFSRNLAADYPLTGGGFATFTPELFERYAPNTQDVRGPHSVYFQVLAEHGFIGLFLYIALLLYALLSSFWTARRARAMGDTFVECYANMFQFSLIGFLTSGAFLGRAYFDYFFTIVACITILKTLAVGEWARQTNTDREMEDDAAMEGAWVPQHSVL